MTNSIIDEEKFNQMSLDEKKNFLNTINECICDSCDRLIRTLQSDRQLCDLIKGNLDKENHNFFQILEHNNEMIDFDTKDIIKLITCKVELEERLKAEE